MSIDANDIRSRNDKKLFDLLAVDPDVKKVKQAVERMEEKGPISIRRQLLATSVRLSIGMAPQVHELKQHCVAALGINIPIELYVYNSPQFNAACVKPEEGRLFIMFSSSLLEAFDEGEMLFIMGHELGHHLYQHHDIPIGYILRGPHRASPKLALQLFTWSRYAEISADRAGAYCAQDFEIVGRSLFRLASGLSEQVVQFSLKEFLNQLDDMQVEDSQPDQGAPKEDWFSTHPFSPLRVKALQLFFDSVFVKDGGLSIDELEISVHRLMALMEPNYLDGLTKPAETMRRLLFAGAVLVADASGGIDAQEKERFEEFFGKGTFSDGLDLNRLKQELPHRIEQTREHTSIAQRMQVLHDLCLMAHASGRVTSAEREVLVSISEGLNVSPNFIHTCLDRNLDLD